MCDFVKLSNGSFDNTRARCCGCGAIFITRGPGSGHDCPAGTWVNE